MYFQGQGEEEETTVSGLSVSDTQTGNAEHFPVSLHIAVVLVRVVCLYSDEVFL